MRRALKILSLPYSQRQLVVVADDTIVAATREGESRAKTRMGNDEGSPSWADVVSTALFLLRPAQGVPNENVRGFVEGWGQLRRNGIPVLLITMAETTQLRFPPGHPRQGVVYAGHPAMSDVYGVAGAFHRVTFEHKFAEAVRLLTCLGATTMIVESVRGWSHEFSQKLSVPLRPVPPRSGQKGGTSPAILYEIHLNGVVQPHVPDDLAWYPHESTWQVVANTRLDAGLKEFSLSVVYEDDFGIHGGFKSQVLRAGLEFGGSFENFEATIWKISGVFG